LDQEKPGKKLSQEKKKEEPFRRATEEDISDQYHVYRMNSMSELHVMAQSCRADMAFSAESPPSGPALAEDLWRTWIQPVSHLLGHKQNQTKYVCAAKRPITEHQSYDNRHGDICVSIRPALPGQGLSPQSGWLFSATVLHHHTSSHWEPLILASTQKHKK